MGPGAGAAFAFSPASALRPFCIYFPSPLASRWVFRLNTFQVAEEEANLGGPRRQGPELTLGPSPPSPCQAWHGTPLPHSSCHLPTRARLQTHGAHLYLFLKKIFSYC